MNGDRTILSDSVIGSGATSGNIIGIGLEPNGDIVVADADLDALFRVDPVTGAREIFSSRSVETGPDFHASFGIVVFMPESSSLALAKIGLLAPTLILGSGVARRRVRTH